MDDRQGMLERDLLQGVAHALRDEFGVLRFALHDETEGDDDIAAVVRSDHLGDDRNLERSRGAEEIDLAVLVDLVEFLAGVVDQRLHEVGIVFAGHDGETRGAHRMELRRTGRELRGHDLL